MATIIPNKKNDKIVSYKFRVCLGRSEFGKQITRYTTWYIPDNMTPTKAQKAAEKAATEWEQLVRDEYKKDLANPERIREREIINSRMEFSDFVNNVWFSICICDGEHKPTTIEFNRHISSVIADYFSGRAIQSITSTDIQKYLIFLRTKYKTAQGKPVAPKTIRHHYCTLANIFSYAMKQEILLKNPMDKVDCPKLPKKKVAAFSQEQAQTFFSILNDDCPIDFRCMLNLLITTGVRRGELMGLQWGDTHYGNFSYRRSQEIAAQNETNQFPNGKYIFCGGILEEISNLPTKNIFNVILNNIRRNRLNNIIADDCEKLLLHQLISDYKAYKAEKQKKEPRDT